MPDTPSSTNGDYTLDGLKITVKDAAGDIAKLVKNQTKLLDLPSNQIFTTPPQLSGGDSFTIGNTQVGVSASATYNATAFVHPKDVDPDGIVTTSADDAWLKQELSLVANASGSTGEVNFGLAAVNAGGSAAANVRLLDYRRHNIQDLAGQAVIDAILKARFAVDPNDVKELDADSRLAFLAGGSLALSVKLLVADTLSASLAALDRAVGVTGTIQIQTGGTVDFEVGLNDDFRIVFSRAKSGRIEVDIRKAAKSSERLTVDYGISAHLTDSKAVADALETYIAQRLKMAYTDYQKLETAICNSNAFTDLPESLQKLAETLASTLKLGDAKQEFANLKTKVCGLEDKLKSFLEDAASTQVKAAFTASWSRVETDDTVLSFEIDPGTLPDYLQSMLVGNLSAVVDALAKNDPRFELNNYLETTAKTISRGYGFSLSLGKWSFGSRTDFVDTFQRELDINSRQRLSLDSRNSYTGTWLNKPTETYFVDFMATMTGFAANPKVSDFKEFGLHLSWVWPESPSDSLAATRWGDLAELWGGQSQSILSGSVAKVKANNVEAAVDVIISDEGLRAIFQAAANKDPRWMESWGWALAAALPPIPGPNFRQTVADRRRLYYDSARDLLKQNGNITEFVAQPQYNTADERVRLEAIDLGGLDGRSLPQPPLDIYELYSLKTLWKPMNPTGNPSKVFESSRQTLAALAQNDNDYSVILGVGTLLRQIVDKDPFNMRLAGAALTHFLQEIGKGQTFTTSARYTAADGNSTLASSGK